MKIISILQTLLQNSTESLGTHGVEFGNRHLVKPSYPTDDKIIFNIHHTQTPPVRKIHCHPKPTITSLKNTVQKQNKKTQLLYIKQKYFFYFQTLALGLLSAVNCKYFSNIWES